MLTHSSPPNIVTLVLRRVVSGKSIIVGEIEVYIYEIKLDDAVERLKLLAERALADSDIKNQLQPHTLSGKLWRILGGLDSLSAVMSTIGQVAKVCFTRNQAAIDSHESLGHSTAQPLSRPGLEHSFIFV